jgi:hypothetical protein
LNDLKFQLPLGYYFLFLALAAFLSYLLYSKEIRKKSAPNFLLKLLVSIRFIFLSLLFLFLFEPILFQLIEKKEKPILVFAQDNSESILNNKDSIYIKTSFKDSVSNLVTLLQNKYEVVSYSFGQEAKENNVYEYDESITNIESLFNNINNRFYGKNLTDVIICSDGIINNGNNPIYNTLASDFSIHTIALGDSNVFSDVLIKNINTNQYALLGNKFPVEIIVQTKKFNEKKATVNVYHKDKLIKEIKVEINSPNEIIKLNFDLLAKEYGIKDYSVTVVSSLQENNLFNNQKNFSVNVIDKTQNILILAEGPHPDIGALNWALLDQLKTTVSIQYLNNFKDDLLNFDLVIFHKGLSDNRSIELIYSCRKLAIPVLIFTGNDMNKIIRKDDLINLNHNNFNGQVNVSPFFNDNFNSFNIDNTWKEIINEYPPLNIPFSSNYKAIGQSKIFLYQFFNGIKVDYPLVYFTQKQEYKFGVFLGEGIWRWKMSEFNKYGKANVFKNIFQKIAQLLKVIDSKERLKISFPKPIQENTNFSVYGEFYNSNLELNNSENLALEIISEKGDVFQKIMKPIDQHYELSLNSLDKGSYSYSGSVKIDGEIFENKGFFKVDKSQNEQLTRQANHDLLKVLSKNSKGVFIYSNQFHILKNQLLNVIQREPLYHDESTLRDLIHWKWLVIILFLPFVEWLIRKRYGMI